MSARTGGGRKGHDEAGADTVPGLVLLARGGVYTVELADGVTVDASLRGRLKLQTRTGDAVVAGDRVRVRLPADDGATIEEVVPRHSELARSDPRRRGRRPKVIVANIDRIAVVFAHERPTPNPRLIDRFLVLAEANRLPAALILNKADLDGADANALARYDRIGYRVLRVSAHDGRGLPDLKALLSGSTSVLTGPSGVGKSSLLNALWPGLDLKVGEISEAVNKGRHTTVAARLLALPDDTYVADTPGLRELGLWGVDADRLDVCFPEFRPHLEMCRFVRSCSHTHEPGCAVREAVEAGAVTPERYASYVALLEDLAD